MLTQGRGTNCCVRFRRNDGHHANKRVGVVVGFATLFLLCVTIVLTAGAARGGGGPGRANMNNEHLSGGYGEEKI